MSKQITVVLPEEVYEKLREASALYSRPLATEARLRIVKALGSLPLERGFVTGATYYGDDTPVYGASYPRLTLWGRVVRLFKR